MNTRLARISALALASATFATSVASAIQDAARPDSVQEQASVVVIEIPVNVIGRDGKPVAGLKIGDFRLFDDGEKQSIAALQVVDLAQKTPAPESLLDVTTEGLPASARRLWLLVFDLSYTSPTGLARARQGAAEFVARSMGPNDLAAVGTLSIDTGWKLLENFTRDRGQLVAAIETLSSPGSGVSRSPDPLGFAFSAPNPMGSPTGGIQQMAAATKGGGIAEGEIREARAEAGAMQRQAGDSNERGRITSLVGSLGGIGRVLDSVRGRKHVLFFSEGFDTRLLAGTATGSGRKASLLQDQGATELDTSTALGANQATVSGELWKVNDDARFGSSTLRDQLSAALVQYGRSDAVLDTVDIGGLRAENDVAQLKGESGADSLFTMASETSGDFVRNANKLGAALAEISDRTALVYLLVYQPKGLSLPGAFHELKVEVKRPGARVVARAGYYEPRPYESLSPLERKLAAGDILTGGSESNALEVRLLAIPFGANGVEAQVPILLEIPGAALLSADRHGRGSLEVYAYASDGAGTLVDYVASGLQLDYGKIRGSLASGGIRYYGTLHLSPGTYTVRALVVDGATGRSGLGTAAVTVPRVPGGSPVVSPLAFVAPEGNWLTVSGRPRADAPASDDVYPFTDAAGRFVPAVLPTFEGRGPVRVAVFTYNLGASAKSAPPPQVSGEIAGTDGTVHPVQLESVSRSDGEHDGGRKLLLSFDPAGLSPGRYELRIAVTDLTSRTTGRSAGAFEIR